MKQKKRKETKIEMKK